MVVEGEEVQASIAPSSGQGAAIHAVKGDGTPVLVGTASIGADTPTELDKRRERAGVSEVMNIIGDVAGRNCILYDDIIDSGGTLCNAAKALKDHGASTVSAYITHGVLSDPAVERISQSELTEVVITDTIAQPDKVRACDKIRECTTATLLGEAIRRIANDESVSKLFG